MANYSVAATEVGAYKKTLVANTVDTVTFTGVDLDEVEILTDGSADIWVRFDGTNPAVGSAACYLVPALAGYSKFRPRTSGATVVKLISSGTPQYSVART